MDKRLIKNRLNEALSNVDKAEIKAEVIKALKSSDLKTVISTIIAKEIKGNNELEKDVVEITTNVLTQLYKTLWIKRGFWQGMLSNKAS